MTWPLPQNSVYTGESGHLTDHDDIYTSLNSGRTGVPLVVTLTDASTVAINAGLGSDFRLTFTSGVGATRIIGTPSNPTDGQKITITVIQDSSGNRLVTWSSAWNFPDSTGGVPPILSTAPGFADILVFVYNATLALWLNTEALYGFTSGTTVFYDNFGQTPNGQLPDASKWAIATGAPSDDPTLGAQWYVANTNNSYVNSTAGPSSTPALVMSVTGTDGATTVANALGNYNSARISTFPDLRGTNNGAQGALDWSLQRQGFRPFCATYGTVTVVAKFNPTAGFWPAIWLNGINKQWPQCGEIDIIENFGGAYGGSFNISHGYSNVIGPRNPNDYYGADWEGHGTGLNITPAVLNDGAFHTYVCSISSDYLTITMTMDGTTMANFPLTKSTWLAAMTSAGYSAPQWPFGPDCPLMFVANVAVGETTVGPSSPAYNVGYPSAGLTLPITILTIASVKWTIP